MITLYQFPISHFCEKARWTLEFKNIPHKKETLLPGFHAKKMKALAQQSSVPVIDHDGTIIAGSDRIISHLDDKYADKPLTPNDSSEREKALLWEKELDKNIGINIRIICYNSLLERPDQVIPFFTKDGPWYGRFVMPLIFPKMAAKMRNLMNINEESTQAAIVKVDATVDKLLARLKSNEYLVGDHFSRADLTAASLLAPLAKTKKYGLEWPEDYPAELEKLRERYRDILDWVRSTYKKHR